MQEFSICKTIFGAQYTYSHLHYAVCMGKYIFLFFHILQDYTISHLSNNALVISTR